MLNTGMLRSRGSVLATLLAAVLLSSCGSDGGGTNKVIGTALSVISEAEQAERGFVVNDLAQPPETETIFEGTSNENGVFEFEIKGTRIVYVVFPPVNDEPRTSGLVFIDEKATLKTLRDLTDVACVAGVTAVRSGELAAELLTAERIANLETAAQQVIASDGVDFNDDASVGAAAAKVRELTNDGEFPPAGG
jgi:hypothetical protein